MKLLIEDPLPKNKKEDLIFFSSFLKANFFSILLKFINIKNAPQPMILFMASFSPQIANRDLTDKNKQEKKNPLFISIETWTWICWSAEAVRMAGGIICYYLPSKHHHKMKTDAIAFFIMQ